MGRKRGIAGFDWPAYTVERWPIERLKAYERNARTHSPEQIEQLRKAIKAFGWTVPVLAREDGTLIAGHGRLAAALLEGIKEAPVIVARGWTEEQCRAYALADNKIGLNAGWDNELLGVELSELRALGMDLELLGFGLEEIDDLLLPDGGNSANGTGSLTARFGVAPFSVLNAREGWWQDRKRAWLALGIQSELGRGEGVTYDAEQITEPGLNYYRKRKGGRNATPGGSLMPAADYSSRKRGNGKGQPVD